MRAKLVPQIRIQSIKYQNRLRSLQQRYLHLKTLIKGTAFPERIESFKWQFGCAHPPVVCDRDIRTDSIASQPPMMQLRTSEAVRGRLSSRIKNRKSRHANVAEDPCLGFNW